MSLIKIEHLTFSYPSGLSPVFEDASFKLDTNWRTGLIGRNGRGKTTLLRLLQGQYPYSGTIHCPAEVVYFPKQPQAPALWTRDVLAELYPLAEDWQLKRELRLLGLDADDLFWRPFDTLSGGEQTKVLLAGLFLDDAAFPLIDEPTNHLDLAGREAVARYLRRKPGFILVSHDRTFLDACVDHILAINRSEIEVHSGDYTSWQENFARREAFEKTQNARLEHEIRELKQAAQRTANWSDRVERTKTGAYDKGYVGHMAAKMMKRSKATLARRERAIEEKSKLLKDFEREQPLKLVPLTYRADRLVTFEDVQVRYDGIPIGEAQSFTIHRGDRLFLDGPNGCGKTSLLRLLTDDAPAHSGRLHIASGLIISSVPQRTDGLSGSAIDFAEDSHVDLTLFLSFLRKLGFPRDHFARDIRSFSEGQKKKVLLAKSLSEQAHLYVWDEPLNYIDLASRLQIEALIKKYQPTMLLVEHDKAFRDAIATDVIHLT